MAALPPPCWAEDAVPVATAAPTEFYETFHYDCVGCIENGFLFCPLDARCIGTDFDAYFESSAQFMPYACQTMDELVPDGDVAGCSPPENFFNDPLYESNEWAFDMINILPVWEKGYFGSGIRIRVNDQGIDPDHPEVRCFCAPFCMKSVLGCYLHVLPVMQL
ncbi:MAG: hypothetical protein SGARI_006368 [Bacillariaceae sp.]